MEEEMYEENVAENSMETIQKGLHRMLGKDKEFTDRLKDLF